jgi:DNA-binding transcriptional LysR family regulator
MELRHLRYFVAVAEEMNFSRAAERLYIAQPPLTRLIHALEAELGIELFERRKRQISLTPAGEAFLDQAYVILAQCEEAVQMAQRISRGEIGQLRVGFCETAICSFLPEAIRLYEELFPGVRVLLRNMTPVRVQEQVRALQEHRLDVVIAAAHSQKPDIDPGHLGSYHSCRADFFPRSCRWGRSRCVRDSRRLSRLQELVRYTSSTMTGMIPAEGESAADELPMPPHRPVESLLILRPA